MDIFFAIFALGASCYAFVIARNPSYLARYQESLGVDKTAKVIRAIKTFGYLLAIFGLLKIFLFLI